MHIGILGGTFDPIHNAHLFIALDAAARLGLDRVLIIPNGLPPHKADYPVSEARHRLRMVELATADSELLVPEPMEVERPGPSFTVITLRELHARWPSTRFTFLAGADAVAEIGTWREPEAVVQLCQVTAVSRPGFTPERLHELVPAALRDRISFLQTEEIGISSTLIRQRVRARLPIRYLAPDPVVRYIEEHGLYRS